MRISDWSSDVCSSDLASIGMLRFQRAGDDVGIVQYSVPDCHFRQHGKTKTIIHHLHQRVQRRSHYGSLGAKLRPVAGSECMILQAMTVLKHQQTGFINDLELGREPGRERECQYV